MARGHSGQVWLTFPITYDGVVTWHAVEFLNPGCTSESLWGLFKHADA